MFKKDRFLFLDLSRKDYEKIDKDRGVAWVRGFQKIINTWKAEVISKLPKQAA